MISNLPNTADKRKNAFVRVLFILIILTGISACGLASYENKPEGPQSKKTKPMRKQRNPRPGPGARFSSLRGNMSGMMGDAAAPSIGIKGELNPETYNYKHFYFYRESPKKVIDLLADILKHYDYPDVKKDPFVMTIVTGAKPHDSLFVKMAKGDIRSRAAARAGVDREKGETVLALYICVEQKGKDGVWRVIDMPSNQLDIIDSANYETYFHTIEGYLKPKK